MPQPLFKKSHLELLKTVAKFGIAALFFIVTIACIWVGLKPYYLTAQEGDISLSTIYAPFDFTYPGKIDKEKTEAVRKRVEENVPPVFRRDPTVPEALRKVAAGLFEDISAAQKEENLTLKEKAERLKGKAPFEIQPSSLETLLGREELGPPQKKLEESIDAVYKNPVMDDEPRLGLAEKGAEAITVVWTGAGKEEVMKMQGVLSLSDARKRCQEEISGSTKNDARLKGALVDIAKGLIRSDLAFDEEETKARKEGAVRNLPPIQEVLTKKKNEIIVQKGQRVTRENILQMDRIRGAEGITNLVSYIGGIALLLAVFLVIFAVFIKFTDTRTIEGPKEMALVALISVIGIMIFKAVQLLPLPSYVVPFSSVALLITILVSARAGMISCVLLSILASMIFGGRLEIMLVSLVGGLVGTYAVRNIRRRFQIAIAGVKVGVANAVVIIALGLINNLQPQAYLGDSLWGVANGLVSSFIAMGLLPILEQLFKITTNITLLELSDMNHPVLKELILKAPGTYHHSLLVGNLAEAACDAIGANSLLARIGSYYHDIGKIGKAEYFAENETSLRSRHEDLEPSMSYLVIGNHVKDGVEMAKKHKLNQPIIDIIRQHHGTSIMYFFYKKALENSNGEEKLKEDEYRYPGPKPQTKEAAVVLLADAVEAASRTLTEPTPGKIRNLVQRLINNKFIDKQLDESDLTLRDLHKISESFVRILIAAFHVRAEYPDNDAQKKASS